MYCLVDSRISKLEAEAEELKTGEPIVRVSGENAAGETEILDTDEIKGSGRTLTRCVVEIIDSDDEFARGNLSGNELTSQS
ncbi:hypothetical protein Q3G72_011855 [Acer saccharum]|nr:hypothetical protein Q3G72_011855 [Acer saccharum]